MVAALVLAAPAAAADVTDAMAVAAGRTVDVSCAPDETVWDEETRRVLGLPGAGAQGYTLRATRKVRLAPWVCRAMTPADPRFGAALYVVGAEAARVVGYQSGQEGMVGCWGLLLSADVARRVWGIPFFTARSQAVVAATVAQHQRVAAAYRAVCR